MRVTEGKGQHITKTTDSVKKTQSVNHIMTAKKMHMHNSYFNIDSKDCTSSFTWKEIASLRAANLFMHKMLCEGQRKEYKMFDL